MDIELYGRVIWRHKLIVVLGLFVAIALATLSYVRIGTDGKITYRDAQTWASYETISVTQPGFAEGRLSEQGSSPMRLASLAILYSKYIDADGVRQRIWPTGAHHESVEAAPLFVDQSSSSSSALPMISIAGFSESAAGAQRLTDRATNALMSYIAQRQDKANIPTAQRVELQPVKRALSNTPVLWQARSKALSIVIFLTALIATIGLAFILENLNPQVAAVAAPEEESLKRVIERPRAS